MKKYKLRSHNIRKLKILKRSILNESRSNDKCCRYNHCHLQPRKTLQTRAQIVFKHKTINFDYTNLQSPFDGELRNNKTSILWTPGSQVYLSKKKKLFGQQKQIRNMHKSCIIND